MAGPADFAGRERELSRLRAALGGDTRLLLVTGDAGVGKTRFAGEGLRLAAADGVVSVWGACLPLAGALPLLPVTEALSALGKLDEGRLLESALSSAPGYVRGEVGRLLPQLGRPPAAGGGRGEGWRRERLFSGLAELLWAAARQSPLALVIDDVQWADSESLDFLTFLSRTVRSGPVTVVAACRSDESPLDPQAAGWLVRVRGAAGVEEIRLGPLSRSEVAEQVASLVGGPPPPVVVDALYARGEGNPFFTEQLVAAVPIGPQAGTVAPPAGLPARLAELLAARVDGCTGAAHAALAALAVAGRPLGEDLLSAVSGLDVPALRAGLRELAAARLLADDTADGTHRPRHALLAEAARAGLLPGERTVLHERTARALEALADESLAAEAAAHWAAAGRIAEELPARVAAASAAERVFGYAEAAEHLQRAIELSSPLPVTAGQEGASLPRLYVRAIDALEVSGDRHRALALAGQAHHRFTGHADPAAVAVICHRAARLHGIDAVYFRGQDAPAALALATEARQLFDQAPPSADYAEAWLDYAMFLLEAEGRCQASQAAGARALELAEAAGATPLIPRILAVLATPAFLRGEVEQGFALLSRGRALAETTGDGEALLLLAMNESFALHWLGDFDSAAEQALAGLRAARQAGLHAWFVAGWVAADGAEALLARGRTAEAAALIDPLTTRLPTRDHWIVHQYRAAIDLLRGDTEATAGRQHQVDALLSHPGGITLAGEAAQWKAETALWAGRPGDALAEVRQVLSLYRTPDLTILCGRLLVAGMRACADLAEQARAHRDDPALGEAMTAADALAGWADQMAGAPFTGHPFVAMIPAERATWAAERTRASGASDPAAWDAAAQAWEQLGCPHRAGYARWRHAGAQLATGQDRPAAVAALQAAAAAAAGHEPLLAQIRTLAARARITLHAPPAPAPVTPPPAAAGERHGLTGRELAVLRLLAAGATNAQIGAQLFISPKTASVHVTSIMRKLGVTGRVQAAAVAERAGLLEGVQAQGDLARN